MAINIGIVDDHELFAGSLKALLGAIPDFHVAWTAYGCADLQNKIPSISPVPDIITLDVNMPETSGYQTLKWLRKNYPDVKVAALSQSKDDLAILQMLRAGCCAYLFKASSTDEFEHALHEIHDKGFYNGDECNVKFRRLLVHDYWRSEAALTDREIEFLPYACSDLTYAEIGVKMGCTKRNVDAIREVLFEKFKVSSRVGLVIEAIRRNLVTIERSAMGERIRSA